MINHGTPVISSRQWTYALAPNPRGGWNFITCSYNLHALDPVEWIVVKDFTGPTPTVAEFETLTGVYANSNFNVGNQLRAANGRIFFPLFQNYLAYYDPATESVISLGQILETPPTVPHTSTILYSAAFDAAGMLYLGTQESGNRPAMIVRVDPNTLAITVLGYVGSAATAGTTYAYSLVADTGTPQRFLYVAYGESPWQLWALNVDTGAASLLVQVPATGHISIAAHPEGWVATIDMDLGKPDNVRSVVWCVDGATHPYGPPITFTARTVTPASSPLVGAPQLDTSGGIGVVGWRPHGSTSPYALVPYSSRYATPVAIESLCATADGVLGNAVQYQGFFRQPGAYFGVEAITGLSEGPRLAAGATIYAAGYPNGTLLAYDETKPWLNGSNPVLLGYFGNTAGGSGMKYACQLALDGGKLWCAGTRERDGVGAAIGCYGLATKAFAGSYAALDTVLPTGLAVVAGLAVMATKSIDGTSLAQLILFDAACVEQRRLTVLDGVVNLGAIYPTAAGITGVVVGGLGGGLGLYSYDIAGAALLEYVELPIAWKFGTACARAADGSLWTVSGTQLLRIDLDSLTATVGADLGMTPDHMSFGGDGQLYFSVGANLWSVTP